MATTGELCCCAATATTGHLCHERRRRVGLGRWQLLLLLPELCEGGLGARVQCIQPLAPHCGLSLSLVLPLPLSREPLCCLWAGITMGHMCPFGGGGKKRGLLCCRRGLEQWLLLPTPCRQRRSPALPACLPPIKSKFN